MGKSTHVQNTKFSGTGSQKTSKTTSKKTDLPNSWISAIFKKFQILFGSRWTTLIFDVENEYQAEWSNALKNLNGQQIKIGLIKCQDLDWPPTVGEFKRLCGDRKSKLHGIAYKPYVSMPRHKPNPIVVKSELTRMRAALRK